MGDPPNGEIAVTISTACCNVGSVDEQCGGPCNQLFPGGGGDVLGQGCSDTYDVLTNGYRCWLAPASEIDPWRGT